MTRIQKLLDFINGGSTTYEEVLKLNLSTEEKKIVESSKKRQDANRKK